MSNKKVIIISNTQNEKIANIIINKYENISNIDIEYIEESDFLEEDINNIIKDESIKIVYFLLLNNEYLKIIKRNRQDIFLIGINYTYNKNEQESYLLASNMCNDTLSDIILHINLDKYKKENYFIISSDKYKTYNTTNLSDIIENMINVYNN